MPVILTAKVRNLCNLHFVLFMSSFKYAQYSSDDLVIVSCGINRQRYFSFVQLGIAQFLLS